MHPVYFSCRNSDRRESVYALRAENQRKDNRRPNNTSGTNTCQHKSSGIELSLIARFIPKRHLIFKRTRKYSLVSIFFIQSSLSASVFMGIFYFFLQRRLFGLGQWTELHRTTGINFHNERRLCCYISWS